MKIGAVIVAGGKGTRMGYEKNKVLMPICGKEIILYTLEAFSENKYIEEIVLVTGKDDLTVCEELIKTHGLFKVKRVVLGGETRQESVINGLLACDCDMVCIHDGARCLISDKLITKTVEDAKKYGAAAPGAKCKDTLKTVNPDGFIENTVDREKTVLIQTPQVFNKNEILTCHKKAKSDGVLVTDDCAVAEHYGIKIKITEGEYDNLKLTTPEDILTAECILRERGKQNASRTGL